MKRPKLAQVILDNPDSFQLVTYSGRKSSSIVPAPALYADYGIRNYGLHNNGKRFMVYKKDIELNPTAFVPDELQEKLTPAQSTIDATRGAVALAGENGIELSSIKKDGRITKKDVEALING